MGMHRASWHFAVGPWSHQEVVFSVSEDFDTKKEAVAWLLSYGDADMFASGIRQVS